MPDRRRFLRSAALATGAVLLPGCRDAETGPLWTPGARAKRPTSSVGVFPATYADDLGSVIREGLEEMGVEVSGRHVVLKPNFVEYDPAGVINTHPLVVHGAIAAFRSLGAARVTVAEGPGHRRDTEYLLAETGIGEAIRDAGAGWVDLNHDEAHATRLAAGYTPLGSLLLPGTVLGADLLVSLPKLKTHHWAGVTLSMKNMFGIVPGTHYGWPKNILHWAGIDQSILDINATLTQVRRFAIVDGIVGMEGNGPIQGEPKDVGVLVFGEDPVAVDATCCRLMKLDPARIGHIAEAARFLGNLEEARIEQRGERIADRARNFEVIASFAGARATADVSGS